MARLHRLIERHRAPLMLGITLMLLALGFAAFQRLTREIRFDDVMNAVHGLSPIQVILALAFTAASYLALTCYDVLALRLIGRPLSWRTAALASFTSYTLSHNLGLALLTGGSARYRVYSNAGLEAGDVARVVGIAGAMFWSGVVTIAGLALLAHPGPLTLLGITLAAPIPQASGLALFAVMASLVTACGFVDQRMGWHGFTFPVPRPREALAQLAVAGLDIACASAALFVLIPGAATGLLPAFILAYSLAIIVSVITHVPGGVGVFEAVVLAVVPVDRTALFAALIAYRIIYYLLPLAISALLLTWLEVSRSNRPRLIMSVAQSLAREIAPPVLSAASFACGAMLLLSGSLPSLHGRMQVLADILPLPMIELSHIGASLVGTGLLLFAPGLYRRLDGAFHGVRVLLCAGALFSLGKGIDFEEAAVCLVLAGLLQFCRRAFYRRTALTQQPFSGDWLGSAAIVMALITWTGFFAYRRVPASSDLWWQFALHGDAPRFLRASLAAAILLTGTAIWRLMAPRQASDSSRRTLSGDLSAARQVLASASRTEAMLALLGDKRLLFSSNGKAFVMYQISGGSWVVMGDPVGPAEEWPDLLWQLRDMADRGQGRLLLYEISSAVLELAIGMGLQIVKFGEEAIVALTDFELDTPRLRSVRRAAHSIERRGAEFRIVPAGAVPVILAELEAISCEWIIAKQHREKGFSLGWFNSDYISQFDVAVVRINGRIVAFANLWLTSNQSEASVDLMRHRNDAPAGTMDFLFVQLMLWAKRRKFERFSLGMAPLSGIDGRRLAPAWARLASFAFKHGERFYGFQGLRAYKDKFCPQWEPRYVAGSNALGIFQGLRDVSRLINRGPQPAATSHSRSMPGRDQSTSHIRGHALSVQGRDRADKGNQWRTVS